MGRQIGPLLIATLALSVASCGSDGGEPVEPEPERPQITKARLIERADAICTRARVRLAERRSKLPKPERSASIGEIIAPLLELDEAAIRSGAQRIEALGRPSSDADLLDEYLDERTTAANALRPAIRAAKDDDTKALAAALRVYRRNQAQEAATAFGFKVCGLGTARVATG